MRWGIGAVALVAVVWLALPGGSVAADGPSYEDAGPVYAPAPEPAPPARIRFAGLRRNLRNGTAVLFVRVSGPGRVILHGRGVRRLVRVAQRARRVRLPVKPKVRLRHYLRRHRKGRIRVEATLRPFDGAAAQTIEAVVVLKRRHR